MNLIIKIFFIIYGIIFVAKNKKIEILKHNIIVSLTTSKDNMKSLLVEQLLISLLNQTIVPHKILLSINNEDIAYLSDYLKLLIKNKIIELILVKEDFKNFNKYYYIPYKYKKNIIIVVDDNIILEKNAIENLYKSYILYPNAVSARRVYKMNFDEKWVLKPFFSWSKNYNSEKEPRYYLFAIHGEGVLYPPNTLNFGDDFIFYFRNVIQAHDFIIKYFELRENLKTVYVNNTKKYSHLNVKLYENFNNKLTVSLNEYQLEEDFGKNFNLCIYNNIIKEKVLISNETKEHFLNTINNNKMTNNTLIILMTSDPERILGTYEVFLSLLNQSTDISSYQCFLSLSKKEFNNGEKDLPREIRKLIINGWIKLV